VVNLLSLRSLWRLKIRLSGLLLVLLGMLASGLLAAPVALANNGVPTPAHIVVVMEENHAYTQIIGSSSAPYINNTLAAGGALFTQSFAITHPSEPNYLAIFSGSTQGITDDSCPHTFGPPDLGGQLIAAGKTFGGYSESMPSVGYTGCSYNSLYYRKHNPWVNFTDVPSSDNMPFTSFPTTFSNLPKISFVVPNINDDMHNGTISQGDTWLKNHINAYAQWAKTNNSLLIVTWDEDDGSHSNHIATIFYGQHVKVGHYSEHINHYNVLRTMEDAYGLPYAHNAGNVTPITDCWM
jgi:hypothetical protein